MSWLKRFIAKKLEALEKAEQSDNTSKVPDSFKRHLEHVRLYDATYGQENKKEFKEVDKEKDFLMHDEKHLDAVTKNPEEVDGNIKALDKLRSMPRSASSFSKNDSRVAAVIELLGDAEAYSALRRIRWPHGVVCPVCNSTNVEEIPSKSRNTSTPNEYVCLDCKAAGRTSIFSELTGIPAEITAHAIRKIMLCWYLMSFCSISQISRELGINIHEVTKLVSFLHNEVVYGQEMGQKAILEAEKENIKIRRARALDTDATAKEDLQELSLQSRDRKKRILDASLDKNKPKNNF